LLPRPRRARAFEQTGRDDLERVFLETWDRFGKESEEFDGFRRSAIPRS